MFPYNISATAEARNFKIGMLLGLANAHRKNHNQRKKWAWPWAREAPNIWGSPLIFCNGRAALLALAQLLVVHIVCVEYLSSEACYLASSAVDSVRSYFMDNPSCK